MTSTTQDAVDQLVNDHHPEHGGGHWAEYERFKEELREHFGTFPPEQYEAAIRKYTERWAR